jgi:hypothetical protein
MAPPPASPLRPRVSSRMSVTPPPPTYAGHFQLIKQQYSVNPTKQREELWNFCVIVVDFLMTVLKPRLEQKIQSYSDPDVLELSRAETALKYSTMGAQGAFDPMRDYTSPSIGGFEYVETGKADGFLERILDLYTDPVLPMPDPRIDPQEFQDWNEHHPIAGGRRRRTRRHRRNRRMTGRRRRV